MSDMYDYPGDSSLIDNGNLLVNPDFRINQKNIKDITVTTYSLKDIADVWKIDNAPMGRCRAVQDDNSNIIFFNSGDEDGAGITQLVQRGAVQEGETYCISVNILEYQGSVEFYLVQSSYPYSVILRKEIDSVGISEISGVVPSTGYDGRYHFSISAASKSGFKVEWCKLELGDRATVFNHPDYDTEIVKIGEMGLSYSNPNLLYNPNFKINQRNEKIYSEPGYTVDRWVISDGISAEVVDNGIRLTGNKKRCYFCQPISPANILGKKIAFSLSIKVESGYWLAQIKTTDKRYNICRIGNKSGVFKVIAEVPLDTTQIQVRIMPVTKDESVAIVHWAKLEIGGQRSLFTPPNKVEELRKCNEFYIKYYDENIINIPGNIFTRSNDGYDNITSLINIPIELPAAMNKIPKLSILNKEDKGIVLGIAGDMPSSGSSIDDPEHSSFGDMKVTNIESNDSTKFIVLNVKASINAYYKEGSGFRAMPIYLTIKPGSYIAFDAEMEIEE